LAAVDGAAEVVVRKPALHLVGAGPDVVRVPGNAVRTELRDLFRLLEAMVLRAGAEKLSAETTTDFARWWHVARDVVADCFLYDEVMLFPLVEEQTSAAAFSGRLDQVRNLRADAHARFDTLSATLALFIRKPNQTALVDSVLNATLLAESTRAYLNAKEALLTECSADLVDTQANKRNNPTTKMVEFFIHTRASHSSAALCLRWMPVGEEARWVAETIKKRALRRLYQDAASTIRPQQEQLFVSVIGERKAPSPARPSSLRKSLRDRRAVRASRRLTTTEGKA